MKCKRKLETIVQLYVVPCMLFVAQTIIYNGGVVTL
jgi:hypothetical protein